LGFGVWGSGYIVLVEGAECTRFRASDLESRVLTIASLVREERKLM
jgi:hypothetical protein